MTALLLATRDQLRTTLSLLPEECEITEGGAPPASAGERFVAVSEGDWSSNSDESLDEYYGVTVTVSMAIGRVPFDRLGPDLIASLARSTGLLRLVEAVRAAVHSSYPILNAANVILGPNVNGFVEPLRLGSPSRIRAVGPDWFQSADEAEGSAAGLVVAVAFVRARRVQRIDDQLLEFVA